MTDPETTAGHPHKRGVRSHASSTWLVAALIATAICAGLLAGEFVGLIKSPISDGAEALSSPALQTEEPLTVAIARTPGGPAEWSNWAVVIKHLSDEIGVPLQVRYLSKEDEVPEIFAAGEIDIAFVCAHHYCDLSEDGTCVGLCTPIIDGSSTTRAMLVARADDPALSIEDLRGSIVAVSDKSSLGGMSYLSYLTAGLGMSPEEFCGELRLGDTQEQNMHDVINGKVRATVVSSVQVAHWDMNKLKVIEESEPMGSPPVIARSDMDPALRARVQEILVSFDARSMLPEDSAIDGFKVLEEREYVFARELRDACGHHVH